MAALVLMAGNLATSALGFVRQASTVDVFGTGKTDAWYAASIVPQMFYDLTLGAAVSAALIPVFTEIAERDGHEALGDTVGAVLGLAWLTLGTLALVLIIAAQPFMSLLLQAYPSHFHGATVDRSVVLVRVLLPSVLFLGTSDILLSALYAVHRFRAPAFATMFYHLGIIAGAWLLARPLGIVALPIGAVAGAAAQAAVQLPSLLRAGIRPTIQLALTPTVRRILRLYVPVSAGLVISIAGQIIDLNLKAHVGTHVISLMALGTTLTQFPIGITVAAFSFAILPSLSSDVAFARPDDFKHTLSTGMGFILFLTVPAAVGFLAAGTPIVRLVLQHGDFTSSDTANTVKALAGYCLQIPFVGIDQLLIFAFYARRNTVTPMLIGVVGVCIYVISALILIPHLRIFGLALANSIQNAAHALILFALLLAVVGPFGGRRLLTSIARTVIAGTTMGVATVVAVHLTVSDFGTATLAARFSTVLIALAVAGATYIVAAALLKSDELAFVLHLARSNSPSGGSQ
jgi:putative peptidoglycan lipid II flippase